MKIYFLKSVVLCSCQSLGKNWKILSFKKKTPKNNLVQKTLQYHSFAALPSSQKITSIDLLCFPVKFVANFINKHLYYHATLDSWFLCVDTSGILSQWWVSVAAELCDLQASPASLQYEPGFPNLLKQNFDSGVGQLFEADHYWWCEVA